MGVKFERKKEARLGFWVHVVLIDGIEHVFMTEQMANTFVAKYVSKQKEKEKPRGTAKKA